MPSTPEDASADRPTVPAAADSVAVAVPAVSALGPLAAALVATLPSRAFVTLEGDLGAGKTTFVKAVAAAAGLDPADVVSPTFGLIHVHPLPDVDRRIVHADFHRLAGVAELAETGWDDAIVGPSWAFVEWPQRIAAALPADRLDVAFGITGADTRTLSFTATGVAHAPVVAALRRIGRGDCTHPVHGL